MKPYRRFKVPPPCPAKDHNLPINRSRFRACLEKGRIARWTSIFGLFLFFLDKIITKNYNIYEYRIYSIF